MLQIIFALSLPMHSVDRLKDAIALPGVEVTVTHAPCGEWNAYYFPTERAILMCDEVLADGPAVTRAVFAHEYGHAVIHQYGLPITGSQEVAADEFAALALTAVGQEEDLLEMSLWFARHPEVEDVTDPHPSNSRRAYTLACLADGSEEVPADASCEIAYRTALSSWVKLVKAFGPQE